jgi:5-methylcytosine-specific restriction endonuclease McrA
MDCHYCGAPADTKDHIVPIAYLRNSRPQGSRSVGCTVDCCRECNSLLGAKALFSVEERAHEIAECLTRRYKKELKAPVWTDDELAELMPILKRQIEAKQFLRMEVLDRVRNASSVAQGLLERALPLFCLSEPVI